MKSSRQGQAKIAQRFIVGNNNVTKDESREGRQKIMAHSFTNQLLHCVFSTKERRPLIMTELASRLYPYLGGIAREHKMKLLAVGGMPDHIHLLLSLPSALSVAKAMQLIKGNSSKWIHETFAEHRLFEWQEGYGAFSIGVDGIERTISYINNQAQHHQKRDYKSEFVVFLQRNHIEYEERFVFG
ncbi:MAG: IS200/IS605 family transposase [Pyrinomonadaceae bacterium]